jgi:putative tributyrin esterase
MLYFRNQPKRRWVTDVRYLHKHPTHYLLHGLSDDHSIWLRRTSIERYVAPFGLTVVMPVVNRSYYTDMVNGVPIFDIVS